MSNDKCDCCGKVMTEFEVWSWCCNNCASIICMRDIGSKSSLEEFIEMSYRSVEDD